MGRADWQRERLAIIGSSEDKFCRNPRSRRGFTTDRRGPELGIPVDRWVKENPSGPRCANIAVQRISRQGLF